jgi:hypothetical protein
MVQALDFPASSTKPIRHRPLMAQPQHRAALGVVMRPQRVNLIRRAGSR